MNFELLYGVLIAILWGFGDFLLKKAVESASVANVMFFRLLAMSILFGAAFLVSPFDVQFTAHSAILVLIAGSLYVLSTFLGYKALERGNVSIMAAIFASYSIVVVILSVILLGEKITPLQLAAAIVIIAGVALACANDIKAKLIASPGSAFAVLCALFTGLSQFLLKPLGQQFGVLPSLFFMTLVGLIFAVPFFLKSKTSKISLSAAKAIFLVALFYVAGDIIYVNGVKANLAAIIAPVASTFPIVVLALAYVFRKERLQPSQLAGIIFVVAGTILISI